MNLLGRLRGQRTEALTFEQWVEGLRAGGFTATMSGSPQQKIANDFESYVASIGLKDGTVAAAVAARSLLLSQLVFKFRRLADGVDGQLFGSPALLPLEVFDQPFTRPRLLTRAEQHASFGGASYFHLPRNGRMRLLNPDRVSLIIASEVDPERPSWQLDAELVAYLYVAEPGRKATVLAKEEVVQWVPEPHPINPWIGQSWVTAVMREVLGDSQLTDHQKAYYENAATPNMVIKLPPVEQAAVDRFTAQYRKTNTGPQNAGKTLVLTEGADVSVVGSQLQQLEIKDTQGGYESRIATRSRVPAVILGIREGLAGSALNSGNYSSARRMWSDGWFSATAQGLCSALSPLIAVPGDAELTYDPSRVMFLQEDRKDEADIASARATTIKTYVEAGFSPDSAAEAVRTGDLTRLTHTGLVSVQLQKPGTTGGTP